MALTIGPAEKAEAMPLEDDIGGDVGGAGELAAEAVFKAIDRRDAAGLKAALTEMIIAIVEEIDGGEESAESVDASADF